MKIASRSSWSGFIYRYTYTWLSLTRMRLLGIYCDRFSDVN